MNEISLIVNAYKSKSQVCHVVVGTLIWWLQFYADNEGMTPFVLPNLTLVETRENYSRLSQVCSSYQILLDY